MEKTKVLYVTHELKPYVQITEIANIVNQLPQYMNEQGMEIRILMPRFGTINERRHRLHEVVRLSGINIIIDNDDFPLIIKVASLPGARLQVYFLENEDFFKRKAIFTDKQKHFFKDNGDRMIFFNKGVLETVKKFGWSPDIIHCHGWMTSLLPFYAKTAYGNEPVFKDSKVVYSLYDHSFDEKLSDNFAAKAPAINKDINQDLGHYAEGTNIGLEKGAISFSDGIIISGEQVHEKVRSFVDKTNKPKLELHGESDGFKEKYKEFYESLLEK